MKILTFTCEICGEPMLSTRKFKNGNMCTHPFCLDCLAKHIDVKVKYNIGNIEGWRDLLCDWAVLDFDRCYCTYQNCPALVLNWLRKVKCPDCKKSFCVHIARYPGIGVFGAAKASYSGDRNEVLTRKLIEDMKWTRCRECGQPVERVGGRRTIRCGATICHKCGGQLHFGPCDAQKSCWTSPNCWYLILVLAVTLILLCSLLLIS